MDMGERSSGRRDGVVVGGDGVADVYGLFLGGGVEEIAVAEEPLGLQIAVAAAAFGGASTLAVGGRAFGLVLGAVDDYFVDAQVAVTQTRDVAVVGKLHPDLGVWRQEAGAGVGEFLVLGFVGVAPNIGPAGDYPVADTQNHGGIDA